MSLSSVGSPYVLCTPENRDGGNRQNTVRRLPTFTAGIRHVEAWDRPEIDGSNRAI